MADSGDAFELLERALVEDFADQAGAEVSIEGPAVGDDDTGGFLPAMLEDSQRVEDVDCSIGNGGYGKNTTLVLRVLRLQTSTPLQARISMRLGPVVVSSLGGRTEPTRSADLVSYMVRALATPAAHDVGLLAATLSHRRSALGHPAYLTAKCI